MVSFVEEYRGESEGRILVMGESDLQSVTIEIVPSSLSLTSYQLAQIPVVLDQLAASGISVTDGPTYRLESWLTGDHLHLRLSERSYYDSVLLKAYPDWGVRSQVLAVVAVTQSPDGYLVEKRSAKVAALPGRLHPLPSGSVEPPCHPAETLYMEAQEELGLQRNELYDLRCLGLVYGEQSGVCQLVCRASTQVGRQQLAERECSGEWEKDEILYAPLDADGFQAWIHQRRAQLTVGGRMALLLEGHRRWGEEWFSANL